jgi:hypothetical protein
VTAAKANARLPSAKISGSAKELRHYLFDLYKPPQRISYNEGRITIGIKGYKFIAINYRYTT